MSNYAKIKLYDIANGEGIGVSIFLSGCEHYCRNCFNKELWNFDYGEDFTIDIYKTKIKPYINEHISHISILGGEPLHPNNAKLTSDIIDLFTSDFPDKTIWIWSGYTFEELLHMNVSKDYINDLSFILTSIDVLVDGKFIEEEKDLTLKWRGSRNQRVIDVKKSIEFNEIMLYDN